MVYQDCGWLHQYGCQCYRVLPFANALLLGKLSIEDDRRRYVYEILRHDDCCAHVDFEELIFSPTRSVEGEPGRVEQRATDMPISKA